MHWTRSDTVGCDRISVITNRHIWKRTENNFDRWEKQNFVDFSFSDVVESTRNESDVRRQIFPTGFHPSHQEEFSWKNFFKEKSNFPISFWFVVVLLAVQRAEQFVIDQRHLFGQIGNGDLIERRINRFLSKINSNKKENSFESNFTGGGIKSARSSLFLSWNSSVSNCLMIITAALCSPTIKLLFSNISCKSSRTICE